MKNFLNGVFDRSCQSIQLFSRMTGIPVQFLSSSSYSLKLLGGKGGFGSLLRGQGMAARVDNFDACRDLSGRRIRHTNNEIRLKEWEERQQERKKAEPIKVPQKRKKPDCSAYKAACVKSKLDLRGAVKEGIKNSTPKDLLAKPKPREEDNILSLIHI